MEKIAVIGTGYVGLVTGVCFAQMGNKVICVDNNKEKIEILKSGKIPIYEPGLLEMAKKNAKAGRLFFSTEIKDAVEFAKVIFIAVGTPPKENGEADLSAVEYVSKEIARHMKSYKLIVEKSTVPVETGRWVEYTMNTFNRRRIKFDIASNPEFLREGSAIKDFMHPDRVVIGVKSKKAEQLLKKLYKPLKARIVVTDTKSAEIIKHASNSFLSMKISFINTISRICDACGADVKKVAEGMGLDKRIGPAFLNAGIGYGGFCFPKDLSAFIHMAKTFNYKAEILNAIEKVNHEQRIFFVKKIKSALWNLNNKTVGVLGLSFKPNTDDIRLAPSIDIIKMLQMEGVRVKAYDPKAAENAKKVLRNVEFCKDAYSTARGSDCLVIVTEWPEFKNLDLKRVKKLLIRPVIVDGRNMFEPAAMRKLGFDYVCIGRK
ncbi:MAG: UDP-glucose/GDP-mannose dehydrogenase family protein [Candidatus Omnitrophica bacterium]|nr:UDP-glucose/GDP-mannose dehydrogenase family protein [Candidatus Omnitrophota bacterium]